MNDIEQLQRQVADLSERLELLTGLVEARGLQTDAITKFIGGDYAATMALLGEADRVACELRRRSAVILRRLQENEGSDDAD